MEGRRRKKGERDLGTKIFILDLKMRTLLFATTINLTSLLLLFLFFISPKIIIYILARYRY